MIDPEKETIFSLKQAQRHIPGHPSYRQVWLWTKRGCKSVSRKLVRMERIKIGGCLWTSVEAYRRFIQELNQ